MIQWNNNIIYIFYTHFPTAHRPGTTSGETRQENPVPAPAALQQEKQQEKQQDQKGLHQLFLTHHHIRPMHSGGRGRERKRKREREREPKREGGKEDAAVETSKHL